MILHYGQFYRLSRGRKKKQNKKGFRPDDERRRCNVSI